MGKLTVGLMRNDQLPKICRIETENFSVPWSEKSFLDSMERTDTVFAAAEISGEVAGYLGCYCIDGVGEITNVAVEERFRRQGVAGALLEFLYIQAEKLDTREFFLEVRESNFPAINLYKRAGFQEEGMRKNFYTRPVENAIIMWKH